MAVRLWVTEGQGKKNHRVEWGGEIDANELTTIANTFQRHRPLSRGSYVDSPENKMLCFCPSSLTVKKLKTRLGGKKSFVFIQNGGA